MVITDIVGVLLPFEAHAGGLLRHLKRRGYADCIVEMVVLRFLIGHLVQVLLG